MNADSILFHGDEKTGSVLVRIVSDIPELEISIRDERTGEHVRCLLKGHRAYEFVEKLEQHISRRRAK